VDKRDYRLGNDRPRLGSSASVANVNSSTLPVNRSIPTSFQPRFIRLRDAPSYFGMDKNRFNREIRRLLTQIPIGRQGVAFDLLEMEAAAEDYKNCNGVPVAHLERRKPAWEIKRRQASPNAVGSGTSISGSEERAFARALEQAICGKPGSTLPSG
jgi:hypothetical protein